MSSPIRVPLSEGERLRREARYGPKRPRRWMVLLRKLRVLS